MSYISADMKFQEYEERKHYSRAFQVHTIADLHKAFAFLCETGRYDVVMNSEPMPNVKFILKNDRGSRFDHWSTLEKHDYLVSTSGGNYYVMSKDAFEYTFVERKPIL